MTTTDPTTQAETFEQLLAKLDPGRIPPHVAIIMDGNGRWAQARHMDRSQGHVEGVNTVRRITEAASEAGCKRLTLYAFSVENWQRPQAEVDALMHLIGIAIERETPDLVRNNVRLTMIGDIDRMPAQARQRLQGCFAATAACTGLNLCLALSYSGRWDMAQAAATLAREAAAGMIDPACIDEEAISQRLATAADPFPDPDLLIRTGGEHRLSNFLLWQAAYAEILVCDTFWPDFAKADFARALLDYQSRQRRFGRVPQAQ